MDKITTIINKLIGIHMEHKDGKELRKAVSELNKRAELATQSLQEVNRKMRNGYSARIVQAMHGMDHRL